MEGRIASPSTITVRLRLFQVDSPDRWNCGSQLQLQFALGGLRFRGPIRLLANAPRSGPCHPPCLPPSPPPGSSPSRRQERPGEPAQGRAGDLQASGRRVSGAGTKRGLASVHEAALGLAEAGLMSKRTMRKFDEMCLRPVREMTPEDIPRASAARACEPGGVRALPQRDDGSGEPVGARREAPAGRLLEAPDAGGEETVSRRSPDGYPRPVFECHSSLAPARQQRGKNLVRRRSHGRAMTGAFTRMFW